MEFFVDNIEKYLFDACAFITYIEREEGKEIVDAIIAKAENGEAAVYMTGIQLLEVYYDNGRARGWDYAEEIFDRILHSTIKVIYDFSPDVLRCAGRLKVAYSISLADSVACAAAKDLSARMVTSDHKELEPVEKNESISFCWLPAKPKLKTTNTD